MRWMHLADLHIGKKVNGFSMLEDQKYVLEQVLEIAKEQNLDGMILAGDIYDKSVPSGEAVQLLDWFLTEVVKLELPIYMVSGNHDSGERLSFGSKLLEKSRVHVASVYNGELQPIVLEDAYGPVYVYLLPFMKPIHVRRAFEKKRLHEDGGVPEVTLEEAAEGLPKEATEGLPGEAAEGLPEEATEGLPEEAAEGLPEEAMEGLPEEATEKTGTEEEIKDYNEAIAKVLSEANVNPSARNLLVAHQLVTGAATCDSEELSVGGLDNINAELFADFDYVALGHIHGPQSMTRESIRYAGTLLKYSFSECDHKKCITIVELKEKGEVNIETIPVKFRRDMRIMKGEYATLMSKSYYESSNCQDYIKVILTDEKEIPEVMGRLRTVYPNIMLLEYENSKTRSRAEEVAGKRTEEKQPMEYFKEFYFRQNGIEMDEKQERIVLEQMKEIWGD